MTSKIQIKRTSAAGATIPSLSFGELALVNGVNPLTGLDLCDLYIGNKYGENVLFGGSKFAKLVSPEFTGVPLAPTASLGTNTNQIATTAFVKTSIDNALVDITNAVKLIGAIDASTNPNYPSASKGDLYVITVQGYIGGVSGVIVEVGDQILALEDNLGGDQAAVGSMWTIIQGNLTSYISSSEPESTIGHIPIYDSTNAKLIIDSGLSFEIDTPLTGSQYKIPSSYVVKSYIDSAIAGVSTSTYYGSNSITIQEGNIISVKLHTSQYVNSEQHSSIGVDSNGLFIKTDGVSILSNASNNLYVALVDCGTF